MLSILYVVLSVFIKQHLTIKFVILMYKFML